MKTILLIAGLSTTISISAYAADYQSFIAPSSLSKNITALNKQYKLELKERNTGLYNNGNSATCNLVVRTDKEDRVNYIKIINNKNCFYNTKSNVNYNGKSTKTKDVLGQVNIENIKFIPGCFNCASKKNPTDSLVINRAEDKYYTEFEIKEYNKDYIEYIAKDLFGDFSNDEYDSVMNKLELRAAEEPELYDRNEFKLHAIDTYDLQSRPLSYTIALK
ncbi:hypothetical protein [uncultured Psychrobacter sp.]|uniref:hypothetical protein n=1 Tax=uncultured Psychrobacter sp. TaxID=259303 RepID=UPI00345823B4